MQVCWIGRKSLTERVKIFIGGVFSDFSHIKTPSPWATHSSHGSALMADRITVQILTFDRYKGPRK
jgi:hypothetical protein